MSFSPFSTVPGAPVSIEDCVAGSTARISVKLPDSGIQKRTATAIVYCEAHFGAIDGKTANGLVRHSEKYVILAVIDSKNAGLDAGSVLGEQPNGVPVCHDLGDALIQAGGVPDYFIYGMAPASGMLSPDERSLLFEGDEAWDEHRERSP